MTMGFDPIRLIASREFESHLRRHRLPRGVVNTLETKSDSLIFTYLPRVEKVEAAWVLAVERWVYSPKRKPIPIICRYGGMADTRRLERRAERRAGSSPVIGTRDYCLPILSVPMPNKRFRNWNYVRQ